MHGKNNLAPRSLVDEAEAIAARARDQATELASGWADNTGGAINCAPTGTVIATKTVTPRVTGLLDVWGSATFVTASFPSGALLAIGHDGTQVYQQGSGVTLEANNTGRNDSISTVLGPFPLGTPVAVELYGRAGGGGAQVPSSHSAQIMIRERPNVT